MWQTPESMSSPLNATPLAWSAARASATSGTRSAKPAGLGANRMPWASGSQMLNVTWPALNSANPVWSFSTGSPRVSP